MIKSFSKLMPVTFLFQNFNLNSYRTSKLLQKCLNTLYICMCVCYLQQFIKFLSLEVAYSKEKCSLVFGIDLSSIIGKSMPKVRNIFSQGHGNTFVKTFGLYMFSIQSYSHWLRSFIFLLYFIAFKTILCLITITLISDLFSSISLCQ